MYNKGRRMRNGEEEGKEVYNKTPKTRRGENNKFMHEIGRKLIKEDKGSCNEDV